MILAIKSDMKLKLHLKTFFKSALDDKAITGFSPNNFNFRVYLVQEKTFSLLIISDVGMLENKNAVFKKE